jgi:hypothetical protein
MKATLPLVATFLALSTLGFVSQPADADSYDRAKRQYNQNLRNRANYGNSYDRARAQYNWNLNNRRYNNGDAYARARAQYDWNRRNRPYNYNNQLGNINNRQAALLNQITNGVGNGTLTVEEAAMLRQRVHEIDALEQRLMIGGLSGAEYARLNTQLVNVRQRLLAEMNDRQRRWY